MRKKYSISLLAVAICLIAVVSAQLIYHYFVSSNDRSGIFSSRKVFDPKNTSYRLGNSTISLQNGYASLLEHDPTLFKKSLRLFSDPVFGDLDQDGDIDAAVLLMADTKDIDIMYYAALVLNTNGVASSTELMYLGDRIAPQNVTIQDGRALYTFAERKGGEPLTATPSIGRSVWVHYNKETGQIGEWVKDFEGESSHK